MSNGPLHPQALAACTKAADPGQAGPRGMYNAGCIQALKGNKDEAFRRLGLARTTNRIDQTQAAFDPDLKSLVDDPRFAALLPSPQDLRDPFVEKTRIIHEWADDAFGIGVADAGDVNRDRHADLGIGAWRHSGAAPSGGKTYLYSGRDGPSSAPGRAK